MNPLLLEPGEAVQLGAVDGEFFARYFFPKTCRQESPLFEGDFWKLIDNPLYRNLVFEMFRGSAKTSKARIFTGKRIAYGLSRTILYTGKSQDHAARSIEWLLKQVQFNRRFAETFGLRPGGKWTGTEAEVINEKLEMAIRIIALGMTGSIRGVNVDDYRPDLIIGDDLCDEENTATPDQRQKLEDLWFGALTDSLAPASECPDAKQVLLGTPFHPDDLVKKCRSSSDYKGMTVGICDEGGKSTWPARWSLDTILKEKAAAIEKNQLSLWEREKMCRIVSRESSFFLSERIQRYDLLPDHMTRIMVIDPVPPKDDTTVTSGDTDFEAMTVLGSHGGKIFGLESVQSRNRDPEWTIVEFFRLIDAWKPVKVIVIAYAYEKTLKWLLEKAMKARRRYVQVDNYRYMGKADRRSKHARIREGLAGPLANRVVYLPRTGFETVFEQIHSYPNVSHDDAIETFAVGCEALLTDESLLDVDAALSGADEESIEALPDTWRSAP